MSLLLRIEMIVLSLIVVFIVINSVNKKKMCIQYSLIWILIAFSLLIIAIFPDIVFALCALLGVKTPSNLIYLFGIFALLLVTLIQTSIISKQTERIKFLTQIVSIEKYCDHREVDNEIKK